ncbi:5-formyltetrahydrofolate cyclo-ligase [uncultured Treponema sp.]|uniref:5-formyltetrahydrofolate cyclo-ligase n=1 Tax=uncultured Treponema sp. TaxID=162155 RepID=UPI0025F52FF1|nr:5-formyltetrahydrofolate cyclo-ligase [uncultured Treponema sp.]
MISDLKKQLRKKMRQMQKDFLESLTEKEKQLLAENLCKKVTSLPEYQNADLVLAYIPDTLEADCTPIILDALKKQKKVAVPKVDSEAMKQGKSTMDFYLLNPPSSFSQCDAKILDEQLETGVFGIREPKVGLEKLVWGVAGRERPDRGKTCEAVFERVSVKAVPEPLQVETFPFVIVPGVAFTKGGKRLGHGKGFYDIYINRLRQAGIKPNLCGICLPCQLVEELPTEEHDILMDEVLTGSLQA